MSNRQWTLDPRSAKLAESRRSSPMVAVSRTGAPPRANVSSWNVSPFARDTAFAATDSREAAGPSGGE
jgi:hypothetical protein